MSYDVDAARRFTTAHARQLDRRRFAALLGEPDPAALLAALNAHRNPDGGYGHALEPDLRAPESQPAGAQHAFETFSEFTGGAAEARALADWLASVTLADGGLPFALPLVDATACAPFWTDADPAVSSLQITAMTAAHAHRVPAVADHPWLARATRYCLDAIAELDELPHAYVLAFAVRFLNAVHATAPEAPGLLAKLMGFVPANGRLAVTGGLPDETLHPLDLAPRPDDPSGRFLAAGLVAADLGRLASGQRFDGGWTVDYASYSPAAELEWRGYATVNAVAVLRAHGQG
ncbi:hypothetical protein [Actinomadura flavalba]|uniref:hypothetical protein n=1 Tax=Actinomadura flavalba TaxID=1120938 RepID=UPI00037FC93E|nr:hypothetical protein [Actinomadura flavalba]